MDDVIRRLYRERIAALFLEVDRTNQAAVQLYQRLGFKTVGERGKYYSAPGRRRRLGACHAPRGSLAHGAWG